MKIIKEDTLYEGEFFKGNKEGWGIVQWGDGSTLEGLWVKNKINGIVSSHICLMFQGRYIWTDGRDYEGEWLNQKLHGIGMYRWKDGKVYKGEYINDKKHGYGTYTLQDGRTYEGWWAEGK